MFGIPYFGYMLSIISEIIRYKFNNMVAFQNIGDRANVHRFKAIVLILYVFFGTYFSQKCLGNRKIRKLSGILTRTALTGGY